MKLWIKDSSSFAKKLLYKKLCLKTCSPDPIKLQNLVLPTFSGLVRSNGLIWWKASLSYSVIGVLRAMAALATIFRNSG